MKNNWHSTFKGTLGAYHIKKVGTIVFSKVESKSDRDDHNFIRSLWGHTTCDFAIIKSSGLSGGIMAIWDDSMFRKHQVLDGEDGFIAIYGEWIKIGVKCLMIVVYAPQDINHKRSLWNSLTHLILNFHATSIVLGDFNEVRFESERLGSIFCKCGAKIFNEFISNSGLVDLPMGGRKFTRMNKFGTKLSKIDRILLSHHFVSKWPNAQLMALPKNLSDHCPIVLKTHSSDYGPIPFKFFNSWLLCGDFPSILSHSWQKTNNPNSSAHPAVD
ncbi:RNA-directed DNA polymerase, eukaryota [Artemisia annua]|uniref:RNA-directed DNA polymerase, eukaryota n=1 Tax=Artemisia annua TaxID=35608 RepID=A0A2U1PP67_ARTAN|nr:RNA-directed DNA polymerase, eukaryota [Artemisia annua]